MRFFPETQLQPTREGPASAEGATRTQLTSAGDRGATNQQQLGMSQLGLRAGARRDASVQDTADNSVARE